MTEREKVVAAVECCFHLGSKGCQSCPYVTEVDLEHGCTVDLAGRIIAQLKEQEARVMTPREFDEVRLSKPVWLEVRNMDLLEPALFRYLRPEYGKVAFSLIENRAIERDVTEYYCGWRCWSAEPGDELRRSTMWAKMDKESDDV